MDKLRRGDYIFVWWKGDHSPRHVHVYRDGRLVVKWDLDNEKAMKGTAPPRVIELIKELDGEGLL
jgi:hypothetical protein